MANTYIVQTPAMTGYTDITEATVAAEKKLLARAQYDLSLERVLQVSPQEQNKGPTRTFKRLELTNMLNAIAPMAEGVTPNGQKLVDTDVPVTLTQHGDIVYTTDKLLIVNGWGVEIRKDIPNLLGEEFGLTVETLRWTTFLAGSKVRRQGGVATRAEVAGRVTEADLLAMERSLFNDGAKEIAQINKAGPDIATEPVAKGFWAFMHTNLIADISKITGFTPVEKYASQKDVQPGEIGKYRSFRFIAQRHFTPPTAWLAAGVVGTALLSAGEAPATEAACDVYPILFVGRNALAGVPLQGYGAVSLKIKEVGTVDGSDPLGQRGSYGWLTWQGSVILNDAFLGRLEVGVSVDPTAATSINVPAGS